MACRLYGIKPLVEHGKTSVWAGANIDQLSIWPFGSNKKFEKKNCRYVFLRFVKVAHWNGEILGMTALIFTEDVEDKLQRLQWISRLSAWRSFRFCTVESFEYRDRGPGSSAVGTPAKYECDIQ